jgi:hypothetical protein
MASTIVASSTATIGDAPTPTNNEAAPTCTTGIPDSNGHVPIGSCNSYYTFYPSFAGNVAFAVLFGLTTLVHLAQAVGYKKACWTFPITQLPLAGSDVARRDSAG